MTDSQTSQQQTDTLQDAQKMWVNFTKITKWGIITVAFILILMGLLFL